MEQTRDNGDRGTGRKDEDEDRDGETRDDDDNNVLSMMKIYNCSREQPMTKYSVAQDVNPNANVNNEKDGAI